MFKKKFSKHTRKSKNIHDNLCSYRNRGIFKEQQQLCNHGNMAAVVGHTGVEQESDWLLETGVIGCGKQVFLAVLDTGVICCWKHVYCVIGCWKQV